MSMRKARRALVARSVTLTCSWDRRRRSDHSIFWISHLLADRCEKPLYSRQAHLIRDKGWDIATRVGVNSIGGASLGHALGLKQPFAFANFYAHYALLFWRSEFIRRRPMTHKNQTIRRAPRFLHNPNRPIAIRANFRREPLISNN